MLRFARNDTETHFRNDTERHFRNDTEKHFRNDTERHFRNDTEKRSRNDEEPQVYRPCSRLRLYAESPSAIVPKIGRGAAPPALPPRYGIGSSR